jgi:uncharacterized surface protein with fasciclin (FAS1) repeats
MRFQQLLPVLPLASALVITEQSVFEKLEKSGRQLVHSTQNVLDDALGKASKAIKNVGDDAYHKIHKAGCDVDSWLEGSSFDDFVGSQEDADHPHHPPHHGVPHHPPHDGKPNMTVYELINKSNYTTKLAKLINKYDDIVEVLNSTKANYTIFAPIDAAFEKIPDHGHEPSEEFLKNLLFYHVADGFYPAGRVLHSYTIPTLFNPHGLGHAQRLTVRVTLKGPTINFYSRIVAVNIFGTNGVIHGVDSILIPPPRVATIIDLLPGEFSTLELGLGKTDLWDKLNSTEDSHTGGTLFAPSNFAFQKLGPRINAFLFSTYGQKYLKALLEYHFVVNQTLYSNAFYDATSDEPSRNLVGAGRNYHYDMPTTLGKPLSVDVARYGPFIEIRLNAFSRVTVHDGVAKDGVIQVVSDVLIPPKSSEGEAAFWTGEHMSVAEFKERLEPLIKEETMEL